MRNCKVIAPWFALLLGIGLLALSGVQAADHQTPHAIRYESGRRLRQFERTWNLTSNPAARRRAIAPLKDAVNQFLGGKQLDAAKSLDDARLALASADDQSAEARWAESLFLDFPQRLADTDRTALLLTIRELYATGLSLPKGAEAEISIARADDAPPKKVEVVVDRLPCATPLALAGLGEGDFVARFVVRAQGEELASGEYQFSLVKNLSARLAAVVSSLDFTDAPKRSMANRPWGW